MHLAIIPSKLYTKSYSTSHLHVLATYIDAEVDVILLKISWSLINNILL